MVDLSIKPSKGRAASVSTTASVSPTAAQNADPKRFSRSSATSPTDPLSNPADSSNHDTPGSHITMPDPVARSVIEPSKLRKPSFANHMFDDITTEHDSKQAAEPSKSRKPSFNHMYDDSSTDSHARLAPEPSMIRKPSFARQPSVASMALRNGTSPLIRRSSSAQSFASFGELDPVALEALEMKCNVMVNHLHHLQQERLWVSGRNRDEGVVLKMSRDQYACCPAQLSDRQNGFLDAVQALNVKVAITVNTEVIKLFVASRNAAYVPLPNGLRLQIIPDIISLANCQKHQSAAFIADRGYLVVWDDDPRKVLDRASKLVSDVLTMIWEDKVEEYNEKDEKGVAVATAEVTSDSSTDSESGPDTGIRRRIAWQPLTVAATLCLMVIASGVGFGNIIIEIYYDLNYTRLLFLLVMPLELWVSLFFFQSIINEVLQICGPISQITTNTKFYSGKKPKPLDRGIFTELPHVTIQMPVYKEGLEAVIVPTVQSVKAAISTYEMQGGSASIFINDDGMQLLDDEEAQARRDFYEENNIGWVARPKHNPRPNLEKGERLFVRRGKFKKASNMNYALWISNRVEEALSKVERTEDWSVDDETNAYYEVLAQIIQDDEGRTWANGNIRMGDYILIIDSDTRVPVDCFLDAVSEMEQSPEVAIIQYTSGVMNVTDSFFEKAITYFTNLVYTQIRFAVANGDAPAFVGHNAVLRWSAVQAIGYDCEHDNREKFWSEETVSEDFDIALRVQAAGYILRFGAYTGDGFQEGVSLTVYDELARWEKYAYGCSELLFHPFKDWPRKGIFTKLFINFLKSNMPLSAKVTIMAYIGTYYAIASAWILTVLNYFLMGWYNGWLDHFYDNSFNIYFSMYIVFTGAGNLALAIHRYRIAEKPLLPAMWEVIKWIPLMSIFLGGLSVHVFQAIFSHMFSIDMSWGATSKEADNISFTEEVPRVLKSFKWTFTFCIVSIATMIVLAVAVPSAWRIDIFVAIFPLASVVVSHLFLPLLLNPGLMRFTW